MDGNTTTIRDHLSSVEEPRTFTFDHSYWSHDSFKEEDGYLSPRKPKYADQKKVFDDLGKGMLENAWKGYNCSLFAYGQTGSGKTYSTFGYDKNKGIVPMFCEELFRGIENKTKEGSETDYQVTVSMMEIYNEAVRDLLKPANNRKGGLKVRQHPSKGFYVEGLARIPVKDYVDIDTRLKEGIRNRAVAVTNTNATSSYGHTIVAVNFIQTEMNITGQIMRKSSVVNFVDLAGSETLHIGGATENKLKEVSTINQSLSTLGNCLKAHADQSSEKRDTLVPFQDSVLTKLLKNAVGGNSRTIVIAALSPVEISYKDSLSTLQFADRAKLIKTKAAVNEDPTDALMRDLKEQNELIKRQLAEGKMHVPEIEEELKELKRRWQEEEAAMDPAGVSYDDRLSTLGFADRGKLIKTKASVNEDPTETLMRDLKEQNELLKRHLRARRRTEDVNQMMDLSEEEMKGLENEWREEMEADMKKNKADHEMDDMRRSYEEKLKAASRVATMDPAGASYDDRLSTLRFADRGKLIKTKASVNEDPTDALIRDLKEQNELLKRHLRAGRRTEDVNQMMDLSEEELKDLKREWLEEMMANMKSNDAEIDGLRRSYEEKLKLAIRNASMNPADQDLSQDADGAKLVKTKVVVNESTTGQLQVKQKLPLGTKDDGFQMFDWEVLSKEELQMMKKQWYEENASFNRTDQNIRHDADGAKLIKTRVVVNESTTGQLQLKQKLPLGTKDDGFQVPYSEILSKEELQMMKKQWCKEEEERRKITPHFYNLNQDRLLSRRVFHLIKPGKQSIGNKKAEPSADIVLTGIGILKEHATLTDRGTTITILPQPGAKLMVNSRTAMVTTELHHNDRVTFGSSSHFVLHHPKELEEKLKAGIHFEVITYEHVLNDILQISGFKMDETTDEISFLEDLIQMSRILDEFNGLAEELNIKIKVEPTFTYLKPHGSKGNRKEFAVKVTSLNDESEWSWDRNTFAHKKFLMQQMYENYKEGESDAPQDKDQFSEPGEVYIGFAKVFLQALAHGIEIDESFAIKDRMGIKIGYLKFVRYLDECPLHIDVYGKQSLRKISRKRSPKTPTTQKDNELVNENFMGEIETVKLDLKKSLRRLERSEKKLENLRQIVEDVKREGGSVLKVSAVENILDVGNGDRFKALADVALKAEKKAGKKDGKRNSKTCVLQ